MRIEESLKFVVKATNTTIADFADIADLHTILNDFSNAYSKYFSIKKML